jgi:hypothetical protein
MSILQHNRHKTPPLPDAATVRRAVHPQAFYRSELPGMPSTRLGHTTWSDAGLCPFHQDTHAGSFRVHLGTGSFKCFACGAAGGDVIAFAMLRHGLGFRDALTVLADTWGVRR